MSASQTPPKPRGRQFFANPGPTNIPDSVLLATAHHTVDFNDPAFAELAQSLDPPRLMDVVLTAAFYCAVVRVLASLEVDVEESYRPYLEKYPLPRD